MNETVEIDKPEVQKFTPREVSLMEYFRAAPLMFKWDFSLANGASLNVQITGRWDASDAKRVETLFGMIGEIITAKGESDAQP
jgi:hypothetical protein